MPWTKLGDDSFKCIITHLGTRNAAKLFTGELPQAHQFVRCAFFFGDGGGDGGGGEGDGGGGEGGETGRSKVALGGFVPVFSFCCA